MKLSFAPSLNYDISPGLGAVIGGGTSLLGDVFNLFGQSKANREQEQYNIGLMNQQRQWAVQDLANQNAYNSPVQQMQRLKEAGLNPNLVYGEGIQATGQADQPRSVATPSFNPGNTLSSFSNLGGQTMSALQTGFDLSKTEQETKNLGKSRDNIIADTANKQKLAVFQDIKNIEEKSNGRADPAMSRWFQEMDQNIKGYEENQSSNQSRTSNLDPFKTSLNFNVIKDQNARDWADNARREAMQKPTLALAIQSVQNSLEQNAGMRQANQNAAAEFQNIMESTHVKQIDAQLKNKELGNSETQKLMQSVIDMIILSKALKK